MNYTEGTKVLDGWTIVRELGRGSLGTVYQIERKDEYGIYEHSALKVISMPPTSSEVIYDVLCVMRETKEYYYHLHPEAIDYGHFVRYEAHEMVKHEDGIGCDILIRMELLTPLSEYCLSHKMDEKDIIHMGWALTDTLGYCDQKGFMHRDIKPQNIFVSPVGSFKLDTFGMARKKRRMINVLRKGTEDYMAPEVYLRHRYGAPASIYSLGLVMYKCANYGRLPFLPLPPTQPSVDDQEQALQKRMNGVPLLPPAEAGEGLSAIILKACAYDRKQRYRDVGKLMADLDALWDSVKKQEKNRGYLTTKKQKIPYNKKSFDENAIKAAVPYLCRVVFAVF